MTSKTNKKFKFLGLVAVLALFSLTLFLSLGCIQGGSNKKAGNGDKLTAKQVAQKSQEAMDKVETYSVDLKMITINKRNEKTTKTAMKGKGEVNIPEKKMYMNSTIISSGRTNNLKVYAFSQTQYMKLGGAWTKRKTNQSWKSQSYLQSQKQLMDSVTEITGTEKVNGEECYVLEVNPKAKEILEVLAPGSTSSMQAQNLTNMVKEMKVNQWVDKDNFRIRKNAAHLKLEYQGVQSTMNLTMLVTQYDEEVKIELPEEAKKANLTPTYSAG